MNVAPQIAFLHIRFEGQSFDTPLADLDLDLDLDIDHGTGTGSNDAEIKRSLAGYLNIHPSRFQNYVIDRHATGNLTIRPEAVFG